MIPELVLAETPAQKREAGDFVEKYHSYVGSSRTVGRCMKYLIYGDGTLYGTIWMGSGFKPTPKDILRAVGLTQQQFNLQFNALADNKRFCLNNAPRNFGSRVLKQMRKRVREDWYKRYGDDLRWLVTTVGGGKTGAVYLADNWKKVGLTAGLPKKRRSVSMAWDTAETINDRFVKPTGEDRKIILLTDRI
jgi:hypothetical protein